MEVNRISWIPAFAGMTYRGRPEGAQDACFYGNDGWGQLEGAHGFPPGPVSAQAGTEMTKRMPAEPFGLLGPRSAGVSCYRWHYTLVSHRRNDIVFLLQTLKAGFAGLCRASGRSGYGPAARPSISRGRRLTTGSPTPRGPEMPVRAAGPFERSTRRLPREERQAGGRSAGRSACRGAAAAPQALTGCLRQAVAGFARRRRPERRKPGARNYFLVKIRLLNNKISSTPMVIDASARLKMALKKVNCRPPYTGNQSGSRTSNSGK